MKRNNHWIRQAFSVCFVLAVTPMAYAVGEELVVVGEASDGPGPVEMVEIMNAHVQAGQLYRKKKYAEAVEYLEIAAKGGMKRSQAQLGAILLGITKQDDVPLNIKRGVGWLGVAAHGDTEPAYRKEYQNVYDTMTDAATPEQQAVIDQVVDGYIEKYGPEATKVSCEQTRRAGTRMSRLICTFDDLHKYRDQLDPETFGALTPDGQISDYSENYRSSGFGGTGGGGGGAPGGGGGGPGGGGGGGGF